MHEVVCHGFKVVRAIPGSDEYVPAFALPKELRYRIGVKTVAEGMGPFSVFPLLVDAISFSRIVSHFAILNVEYGVSEERKMWSICDGVYYEAQLYQCPEGTELAKWVKPLGVVSIGRVII